MLKICNVLLLKCVILIIIKVFLLPEMPLQTGHLPSTGVKCMGISHSEGTYCHCITVYTQFLYRFNDFGQGGVFYCHSYIAIAPSVDSLIPV